MQNTELLEKVLSAHGNDKTALIKAIEKYSFAPDKVRKTSEGSAIISLKSVTKIFKLKSENVSVLNDVSLEIRQGEFVAITGASGGGKSTLLQLMGGLDKPTFGNIYIHGSDISSFNDRQLSELRNRKVGFVFQSFYLQPFLTIRSNIEIPGMFARVNMQIRKARARELLKVVGLSDRERYFPHQLSGGQLQRAAIARALFNEPKIILADEPTGNLDSVNSKAIIDMFEELRDQYNVTVVLVTHDTQIASRADRIISLKDGRIL